MMFSNTYIEYIYDVFHTYYGGRSRGLVVKAFTRLSAHNYLVNDAQVPNSIFDAMFQEVLKGNIDDEISTMALLLYFSKLERFTDLQRNWIQENVEKFVDAGKLLPFFKKFNTFIRLPQDIFLKTYLVYKSERERQVFVKYSFDTGTRGKQKTERRRMEEVVSGVYVLEFVVFHGERLVYSIEDDPNGNAKIYESDVLKKRTFSDKNMSRFEQINSMLVKQEMRKDRELLEELDVYINTVHLFEENLRIL
jgi:Na+/phosphate symporter